MSANFFTKKNRQPKLPKRFPSPFNFNDPVHVWTPDGPGEIVVIGGEGGTNPPTSAVTGRRDSSVPPHADELAKSATAVVMESRAIAPQADEADESAKSATAVVMQSRDSSPAPQADEPAKSAIASAMESRDSSVAPQADESAKSATAVVMESRDSSVAPQADDSAKSATAELALEDTELPYWIEYFYVLMEGIGIIGFLERELGPTVDALLAVVSDASRDPLVMLVWDVAGVYMALWPMVLCMLPAILLSKRSIFLQVVSALIGLLMSRYLVMTIMDDATTLHNKRLREVKNQYHIILQRNADLNATLDDLEDRYELFQNDAEEQFEAYRNHIENQDEAVVKRQRVIQVQRQMIEEAEHRLAAAEHKLKYKENTVKLSAQKLEAQEEKLKHNATKIEEQDLRLKSEAKEIARHKENYRWLWDLNKKQTDTIITMSNINDSKTEQRRIAERRAATYAAANATYAQDITCLKQQHTRAQALAKQHAQRAKDIEIGAHHLERELEAARLNAKKQDESLAEKARALEAAQLYAIKQDESLAEKARALEAAQLHATKQDESLAEKTRALEAAQLHATKQAESLAEKTRALEAAKQHSASLEQAHVDAEHMMINMQHEAEEFMKENVQVLETAWARSNTLEHELTNAKKMLKGRKQIVSELGEKLEMREREVKELREAMGASRGDLEGCVKEIDKLLALWEREVARVSKARELERDGFVEVEAGDAEEGIEEEEVEVEIEGEDGTAATAATAETAEEEFEEVAREDLEDEVKFELVSEDGAESDLESAYEAESESE
ncbi:hypothetical protein Q7P37_002172 [Cladosporium fusiforme]